MAEEQKNSSAETVDAAASAAHTVKGAIKAGKAISGAAKGAAAAGPYPAARLPSPSGFWTLSQMASWSWQLCPKAILPHPATSLFSVA